MIKLMLIISVIWKEPLLLSGIRLQLPLVHIVAFVDPISFLASRRGPTSWFGLPRALRHWRLQIHLVMACGHPLVSPATYFIWVERLKYGCRFRGCPHTALPVFSSVCLGSSLERFEDFRGQLTAQLPDFELIKPILLVLLLYLQVQYVELIRVQLWALLALVLQSSKLCTKG